MNTSPYQAPASDSITEAALPAYPQASQNKRLINHLLDSFFAQVPVVFILITVGFVEGAAELENTSPSEGSNTQEIIETLFFYTGWIIYYIVTEHFFGRTLAKAITRTRVVTVDDTRPSFLQIVGRTFCRMIPFDAFSYLSPEARGWHDTIPKTKVVDTSKAPLSGPAQ